MDYLKFVTKQYNNSNCQTIGEYNFSRYTIVIKKLSQSQRNIQQPTCNSYAPQHCHVCFCFKDRTSNLVFTVSFCAWEYMTGIFFTYILWQHRIMNIKCLKCRLLSLFPTATAQPLFVFITSNPVHRLINSQSVVQFFHVSRELYE